MRAWASTSSAGARSSARSSAVSRSARSASSAARTASPRSRASRARPRVAASPAGPLEQLCRLVRAALTAAQLREHRQRAAHPGRPGARVVLDGGLQQRLGLGPGAAPHPDRAVLGPAEGQHVAAVVAIGEVGDPVAPRPRPLEVEQRDACRDEEAAGPGARDRDLGVALECGRARLVEVLHPLGDPTAGDERRALESEPEHLEVGDRERPAELGGCRRPLAGRAGVAARVRDVALVEGEPAVVGPRLERVEEPVRAAEPAGRDRNAASEIELVCGEPGRHPGCRRRIARLPVQAVRALTGGEHRARVVEPPRGPAQPLVRIGRLGGLERRFERRPCRRPVAPPERQPTLGARVACLPTAALSPAVGSRDGEAERRSPREPVSSGTAARATALQRGLHGSASRREQTGRHASGCPEGG